VHVPTAVVYCEANFGAIDGKTANGLVRHSEKYRIVAVIDSEKTGLDAGAVLGGQPRGIPMCSDLAHAVDSSGQPPEVFIFGIAPASGLLSIHERGVVLEAMSLGMDIVSGLHEFLGDDPVFAAAETNMAFTSVTSAGPVGRRISGSSTAGSRRSRAPVYGFSAPTAPTASGPPRRYSHRRSTSGVSGRS